MRLQGIARALLIAAGALLVAAPPAAAVQTFLASDTSLTTNAETTVLSQAWTVMSTSEAFFLLANVRVFNQANVGVQLTIKLDEAAAAFAPQTITVLVPGGTTFTYQVPFTASGLAAGPYTARVKTTADSANVLVLQDESYIGVFTASVPGTVIVSLNGQGGAVQTFATGTAGTDFAIVSAANVHTWNLPSASITARGAITTGSQTLLGEKIFNSGIRSLGVGSNSTRIGNALAPGTGAVAIGNAAQANAGNSIGLGSASQADGASAISIGSALSPVVANAIGIGGSHTATGSNCVTIGASSACSGTDSVALGAGADVTGTDATALGASTSATNTAVVAVGNGAIASAANAIALGADASASAACAAIGMSAVCSTATDLVLGSVSAPLSTIYAGEGKTDASAVSVTYSGTGGSGANNAGGKLIARGGPGTGSGAGGRFEIHTCPAGGAGSSPNACVARWIFLQDGTIGVQALGQDIGELTFPVDDVRLEDIFFGTTSDPPQMGISGSDLFIDPNGTTGLEALIIRGNLELYDSPGGTTNPSPVVSMNDAFTIDQATQTLRLFYIHPTVTWEQNPAGTNALLAFVNESRTTNPAAEIRAFGVNYGYYEGGGTTADTTASTMTGYESFTSGPLFNVLNGGTLALTSVLGNSCVGVYGTGVTTTTRTCFRAADAQGGGVATLNVNYGFKVEPLSGALMSIGLENADTTVYPSPTAQVVSAGSAILVDGTKVKVTSVGAVTVTAAPTIATPDSSREQFVCIQNVDTADAITIQDQGTLANSNLRLTTATYAMGPRDSICLNYDPTIGDWVEWFRSNVI